LLSVGTGRRPPTRSVCKGPTSGDNIARFAIICQPDEVCDRHSKAERHIRLLAPLAFFSPRIIAALIDGTVPADLTVTGLARTLPYSWTEQERRIGLPQ